jgi:hypothetical protein
VRVASFVRASDYDRHVADEERRPERAVASAEALVRAGEDRRGWGRASIIVQTHPLHPEPPVSAADFLLTARQDPLRLAGDCAIVGVAFAVLAYFPLLLVAWATTADLSTWIWGTMGTVGALGAAYVLVRSSAPDTRDLDRF